MAHLPPTVQCILFLRFGIVYATQLFDSLTFVTSESCFCKNMQQLSWNRLWVSLLALLETLPIYSISLDLLAMFDKAFTPDIVTTDHYQCAQNLIYLPGWLRSLKGCEVWMIWGQVIAL